VVKIGASSVRLEAGIALPALLARFPSRWLASSFCVIYHAMSDHSSLRVKFHVFWRVCRNRASPRVVLAKVV
jgi:hypothetical protein